MKKSVWIAVAVLAALAGLVMLTGQWQFASVPPERAKITVIFFRVVGILWLVIATACLRSAFRQQSALALLKSVSPQDRLHAVRRLARLAGRRVPNAFEALDRAAVDVDDDVRHAAMLAIEDLQRTLGALPLTPIRDLNRLRELTRELLSSDVQQQRLAAEQARKLGDPWLYQRAYRYERRFVTLTAKPERAQCARSDTCRIRYIWIMCSLRLAMMIPAYGLRPRQRWTEFGAVRDRVNP
jgi:hypothetical protein